MQRKTILYIDSDSGKGGSSRSLFNLVASLDREYWFPVVALRQDSPLGTEYRKIGVVSVQIPHLPTFRPAARHNWLAYLLYLWKWRKLSPALTTLAEAVCRYNVQLLHLNHENLAFVAATLSAQLRRPWIVHVRATIPESAWARRLYRKVAAQALFAICISEQNYDEYRRMAGNLFDTKRAAVVHNPTVLPASLFASEYPRRSGLRVVSLSHIDKDRGVDRIVEVASELASRGRMDIQFEIYGGKNQHRYMPFVRHSIIDRLAKQIAVAHLHAIVKLRGWARDPGKVLADADVLIRLRRQMNPWGRDIIEAMTFGLAVVTLGSFYGFVEPGRNGYIAAEYRPKEIADYLERLANSPDLRSGIAAANREKALRMFSPATIAAKVSEIYNRVWERIA